MHAPFPPTDTEQRERPDLLAAAQKRLGWWERQNLRVIRASLDRGRIDRFLRLCQRTVGQAWISYFSKNLRRVVGLSRLSQVADAKSVLLVANQKIMM